MPRYRVEVSQCSVFFVDETNPEYAAQSAIKLAQAGVRPDYKLEATADVDAVAQDSQEKKV